jgi:hypothetical protein
MGCRNNVSESYNMEDPDHIQSTHDSFPSEYVRVEADPFATDVQATVDEDVFLQGTRIL